MRYAELANNTRQLCQKPRNIPLYKRANWDTMRGETIFLWWHIKIQKALIVEGIWQHLKSFLSKLVLDHIPHKMAKHNDKHAWVPIEIKKLIKKRDGLYK